jgi:hypothetical protein
MRRKRRRRRISCFWDIDRVWMGVVVGGGAGWLVNGLGGCWLLGLGVLLGGWLGGWGCGGAEVR